MADPVRPEDVAAARLAQLPPEVIEIFNELIARRWDGRAAQFDQNDVITAIMDSGIVSYAQEIFDRHLLDVEPVYRAAGWLVTYDKPGWNETYSPKFIFTRKD